MAVVHDLRRLTVASGLSNLADGVFQITLPLIALGITRNPSAFASVTLVGRLPWLLFSLPAGALADRLDRRRTMVMVNAGRATLIALLAAVVATDVDRLWILYVVAFALGVGETFFDTAAQSIVPTIVDDHRQLSRANGRLATVELTANQFIGPPLGALIAGVTLSGALGLSSVAYLGAGLALLTLTGQFRPASAPVAGTTVRADIAEGIRYLSRHRLLRALAICVGLSNLASTAMISVLPLYAIAPGPVGLSEAGYGLLLTTVAAGAIIGTTQVQRLERWLGTRGVLLVASASFAIFSIAPAATSNALLLGGGVFVGAVLASGWNVITVSLRQSIVPDWILGRVNSCYRLVAWGTMPLGAGLGGLLASRFGFTTTFWILAAISALCFPIVVIVATTRRLDSSRRDALAVTSPLVHPNG